MHTQRRHIVRSTMDVLESRRLLASVAGTVFSDTDADGRLDAGEAGLAGRTVFADYNYNRRFDAGDVSATTDANGNYTLTSSRTTGISLLVTLNSGELVSLPYGASDLWIPTISGPGVSGKNIGIRLGTPPPATTRVVGYYYIDANHNTRRDAGETGPSFSAGVYVDLNDNRQFDAGEPNATPRASDGRYLITDVPVGVYVIVRPLSISTQDGQPRIFTEPSGWNIPHYSAFSADGNTLGDWNFGVEEANVGRIYISAFTDLDRNGVNNDYESEAGTFWYDAVPNGVHDDYEPFFTATQPALGDPKPHLNYYLDVPYFTFRIAGQRAGDRDNVADLVQMVTVSATNRIAPASFVFSSPGTVLRGVVYNDLNRNGGRDPGESFRNHVGIFADYNDNRLFDSATETLVYTDISGKYAFEVGDRGGTLRLYDPTNQFILTGPAVEGYRFAPSGTIPDLIGGLDFGVVLAASSTVTGTVFADADRDGRLDAGETGLVGRTVFADYNYNGRLDAGEASAITDATGLYSINTRSTQVSLRLLLNAGETVSLPYGATSIWLSSVSGIVTGKNLGVIAAGPATTVLSGFVYLDSNGNGRRDPGELPPYGVSIAATVNGSPIIGTLSESTGEYRFPDVPVGATATMTISFVNDDSTVSYLLVEPNFTSPQRTIVAQAVPQTAAGDFRLTDSFNRIISVAFKDLDQDNVRDLYDPDIGLADRWLDVNANGLHDAGDLPLLGSPTYANNNTRPYAYLNVPAGTWRIAMRRAGDTDLIADEIKVVTFSGVNQTGNAFFVSQPTLPVVSGVVFSDDNGNGVQDAGEGGLSTFRSFGIFVDYNDNYYQDANEPDVQSEFDGSFFFESAQAGTVYVDMSASLKAQTFPAPATMGQRFDPAANQVSGLRFGYRDQSSGWVNGSVFIDVNHNGRRDADDLDAAGRLVYADYNFNGRFDASEAAAYTDQFGSYHLATRGTNLNIRVALEPGEIVSLPYGASSLWIPNVDASVYGKNIGLVFTQHG